MLPHPPSTASPEEKAREKELEEIALRLRTAAEQRRPIPPPSGQPGGISAEEAYRVQGHNTRFWRHRQKRRPVGAKVGLADAGDRRRPGGGEPVHGTLYADMARMDGEEIPAARTIAPRAAAGIALVLGQDLTVRGAEDIRAHDGHGPFTLPDIVSAVDYALPCLEVADCRIQDWKTTPADMAADNALALFHVLGGCPRRLEGLDLRLCGAVVRCAGAPLTTGIGASCMGHPLNAATWLANALFRRGSALREGDVILAGPLAPPADVRPGQVHEVAVSGLGSVRAVFAPAED